MCRECEVLLDAVEAFDGSGAKSLSECVELSSRDSSGIDSTLSDCEDFVARGRMKDSGGASLIKLWSSGSDDSASHSSSFFATQRFCVHLSLEKYALHACVLDRGSPWSSKSSRVVENSLLKSSMVAY